MKRPIVNTGLPFYGLILLGIVTLFQACQSKKASPEVTRAFGGVIPKPVSAVPTGNTFNLTKETTVSISPASEEINAIGKYVAGRLGPATGFAFPVSESKGTPTSGILLTTEGGDPQLGDEGYELIVTEQLIKLVANKPAGLFRGVQTLRQILPDRIEQSTRQEGPWEIATGTIRDYPQYNWRGSMLDVARHFFSVGDVKRYIDLIADYKMNVLHLGLSNDQGWRIEIKSRPELTRIGGSTQVGGGKGGFYTQEQYKEIIAYAASQYILIVPEIDMPGHINAALASYAELNAGIPISREPRVNPAPGSLSVSTKPTPGVLYTGEQVGFSTLHLEKEATFKFVADVLSELAALTPGPYLHIGGDEAAVTKKEDYKIFIDKFNIMVKQYGKKMIGWEEIAQGNIDSGVVAQYWHSSKYAVMAAEKGAKIIMSPAKKTYLDMQYDSTTKLGQHWAAYIEIDSAYGWDPATISTGIPHEQIMGVEAPLWTEKIVTMDDIEFMIFPRMPAIAEIGWTPTADRKWDEFKVRLGNQGNRWKAMDINFYKSKRVPWIE